MAGKKVVILGSLDITSLLQAREQFKKGLAQAKSELERDGVIQRFEFTYELAWKTLKHILAFKGLEITTPREVFRAAAKAGLIENPLIWFDFIKKRNAIYHDYDQEHAEDIFNALPRFEKELDCLVKNIEKL